jgi:hypothetical protein
MGDTVTPLMRDIIMFTIPETVRIGVNDGPLPFLSPAISVGSNNLARCWIYTVRVL